MASLTLKVGNLTAAVEATDANATRILQGFLKQNGVDLTGMTGQQQVNAVLSKTIEFYNESATASEISEAVATARDAVIASPPSFNGV